jgi:predicted transposase YdaD
MLDIELRETRVYQDAKAEGHEEGRVEEARVLLLKQLTHKLGRLSLGVVDKVNALSIDRLESLGVALFDLSNATDLNNWLNR